MIPDHSLSGFWPRVLLGSVLSAVVMTVVLAAQPVPGFLEIESPPFCFPPNPPPLGALIVDPPAPARVAGEFTQLAPFVGELFYPALGTGLFASNSTGPSSRKDEKLLAEFRAEREALLAHVRERLPALAALPAADRRAGWEALARGQAARLAALEQRAGELRARFASDANWNDERSWRLGRGKLDRPRGELHTLEFLVVRAAVYYQEGLSPPQRRLLRERAMQLESDAFSRTNSPPTEGAFVWFSPDTTQIFLPPDTPPTIAQAFMDYAAHKSAVQTEIQDAIYEHDHDRFDLTRRRALADLASAQEPHLVALEREAEELRQTIAAWGGFPRRQPVPVWPESLQTLVATYDEQSAAVEKSHAAALAAAMADYPPSPKGSLEAHVRWKEERRAFEARERERVDQEFAAERATLDEILDQIRIEISRAFGPQAVLEQATADGFLRNLQRVFRRGEAYYEYDIAVLEPGLSPELRRLLLSGALEKLELPLPGVEWQAYYLKEIPNS